MQSSKDRLLRANTPDKRAFLLWLLPAVFLLFFFYQPLLAIFRLIFSAQFRSGWDGITLQKVLQPLGFTIYQAALSTLFTLALGLPCAYIFSHYTFPGKKILRLLVSLPFILPTVVVAAGFNALLGPRGWINLGFMALLNLEEGPIRFLNSFPAIIIAHVFYNTTIIIRIVGAAWSGLNERILQAAAMLGAKPARAFREVTLPLLSPAITAAALLVFLFDFTSFGVVLMLGGPKFATLEVSIYTQAFHLFNLPMAGLLSLIQLICTLVISIVHNRLSTHKNSALSPRSESANLRKPKTWQEKAFISILLLVLFTLVLAPLLGLGLRSVFKLEAARGERGQVEAGLTLDYYRELFENRQGSLFYVPPITAIRNSLFYSSLTVLITLVLGTLVAYALNQVSKMNRWVDPLFMLPLGASAVTLGLGFIVVFNTPTWTNPAFPILIPIAHSLIALPFVVRTLAPAIRNIPHTLRQAAGMLGAAPLQVLREVDLPILRRSLLVSAVFAFTISLGEFGASSFISTPDNPTIPVAIYRYISQPGALNYGQALAMSTLLLIVCSLGIWLIEKLRLPGEEVF